MLLEVYAGGWNASGGRERSEGQCGACPLSFLRTQPRVRMAQVLGSVGHSSRVRKITWEGEQSEKTELALEMSSSLCEKSPGLGCPLSAGAARSLTVRRKGKAVPADGEWRVLRQLC